MEELERVRGVVGLCLCDMSISVLSVLFWGFEGCMNEIGKRVHGGKR